MAIKLVRYRPRGSSPETAAQWGVVCGERIAPLEGRYETTGDVVRRGRDAAKRLGAAQAKLELKDVHVLAPVTANQQFICQGVNYASHVRESGLDPRDFPFNTIFTKASSCISGPHDDVVRPRHVQLLDYEIELGLVLARNLVPGEVIAADRLHEVLAGVTIVNDVS